MEIGLGALERWKILCTCVETLKVWLLLPKTVSNTLFYLALHLEDCSWLSFLCYRFRWNRWYSPHSLHMRNSCWHSCFHLSEIFQLYTISDLAKHGFWKLYSLCLGSSLQRFLIGVKSPSLPCSLCQSCCSMNRCACPWTLLGHKGWAGFSPWACKASPVSASALPLGAHSMFSWLAALFSWGFISP